MHIIIYRIAGINDNKDKFIFTFILSFKYYLKYLNKCLATNVSKNIMKKIILVSVKHLENL